ncbi:actin cortical patch protein [Ophiostoma piceae UAMH 11346]|uniref:Actin cortical patch protein n=1 Tax=Ophiostoma piceae (strain UAMH 11346) TaxID=1262450 RepID=S3C4J6_OPHP1|nr:actin cortical patch protein [Ophiostoma piceae UAMH 11346]
MKLTPIRVRGKRKRPARASSVATRTPSPSTSQPSTTSTLKAVATKTTRKYGKPDAESIASTRGMATAPLSVLTHVKKRSRPSSPSFPASSPPAKIPRMAAEAASPSALSPAPPRLSRRPKNRPVPFDRRFPFEIIERIFLLSKNLNLPKSSPRLGWLLSGRRTLIEMVILAFGPTWDLFTDGYNGTALNVQDALGENVAKFQTSILTYSWAKVDLLLDAEHLWVQRKKLTEHLRSLNYFGLDISLVTPLNCVVNPSRLPDLLKLHPRPDIAPQETGVGSDSHHQPPKQPPRAVAIYPCFTFDQLVFMLRCHEAYYVDPSPDEEPLDLLEKGHNSTVLVEVLSVHEINYCLDKATSPFIDHSRGCRHWHVHAGVRIPEWLLLCGGPYYKQRPWTSTQDTRNHRDTVRRRLRIAFDTFYWVVQGGARLSHTDSWEVTLQGVRNLLDIDLTPYEEEEQDFVATARQEDVDKRLKDWGVEGMRDDMVRMGYSLDSLVMGYLALLGSLGLFTRSWPAKVMEGFMLAVTERAVDDPSFRKTRTFLYLQRAALHRWSLTQIHEMTARDPLSITALDNARARYLKNAGYIENSTSAGSYTGR